MRYTIQFILFITFAVALICGAIRFAASIPMVGDMRPAIGADTISQQLIDKYGYQECYIGQVTKWDLWGHGYGPRPLAVYKRDAKGRWFLRLSNKPY